MLIKICGLNDAANIKAISRLPVDILGFVFHSQSPRNVQDEGVKAAIKEAGAGKQTAGVFVNQSDDYILQRVHDLNLAIVQLHGNEKPEQCKTLLDAGITVIKAFSLHKEFDFAQVTPYASCCSYYLFDTQGKQPGGNGYRFDWNLLHEYSLSTPFFLSGGLEPALLPEIDQLKVKTVAGLDFNSKIEQSPGCKSLAAVEAIVTYYRKNHDTDQTN